MDEKELRIGNWVNWEGSVETVTLNSFGTEWHKSEGRLLFRYFKPIPLNEEWLVKFGFSEKFKSSSNRWMKHGQHSNIYLELHDIELSDSEKLSGVFLHNFNLEVKHVHSLQNLYFALTNEELTIK
jgi:hypothetical protein